MFCLLARDPLTDFVKAKVCEFLRGNAHPNRGSEIFQSASIAMREEARVRSELLNR